MMTKTSSSSKVRILDYAQPPPGVQRSQGCGPSHTRTSADHDPHGRGRGRHAGRRLNGRSGLREGGSLGNACPRPGTSSGGGAAGASLSLALSRASSDSILLRVVDALVTVERLALYGFLACPQQAAAKYDRPWSLRKITVKGARCAGVPPLRSGQTPDCDLPRQNPGTYQEDGTRAGPLPGAPA
jgi:hypothetical protein